MDNLLTPVKTVRNVKSNIERFETLSLGEKQAKSDVALTRKSILEISNGNGSTSNVLRKSEEEEGEEEEEAKSLGRDDHTAREVTLSEHNHRSKSPTASSKRIIGPVSSPEQALAILKQQPTEEQFAAVISYLEDGIQRKHAFNFHVPSAPAAQILNVLVTNAVPDRWTIINSTKASRADKSIRKSLLLCMSSVAGIGAMVARLQSLLTLPQIRQPGSSHRFVFKDTVSLFASIVYHKTFIKDLLYQTQSLSATPGQRQAVWAEATSLLAGSKVLNVFQEASAISELDSQIPSGLQDPREYSGWLGLNIASAAISLAPTLEDAWKMLANLMKRALSLGHRDSLVVAVYTQLLLGEKALWTPLRLLSTYLPRLNQKMVLELMLQDMSKKFLSTTWNKEHDSKQVIHGKEAVGGVASVVSGFVGDDEYLEAQLIEWLTTGSSPYNANNLETRRATILVLSTKEDKLRTLLEKSMKIFSDKLHIKHDSVLQQEALAQVILLTAGYLHRLKSPYIFELSKSSSYLHAVSNRLATSIPQARFLGMVVGMAISRLVDEPDKIMKFDVEEMESQEAEWWFFLTSIEDAMGSVEALKKFPADGRHTDFQLIPRKRTSAQAGLSKAKPQAGSKIISIEEVDDSESEDDFIPYQKPDEDPEDSDEDPTLINRSKPKAPVYINDLIKSFNVGDQPEVVEVALKTAPSLIRRKANFGTELSENITSVASALLNLQDGMSSPELQELRLQSLIACFVSQPARMGPWFASMYFEGDFSLSQRATVLTTIGLSSREVAGHRDEGTPSVSHTPLPPSKDLPPHLATLYQPINTLSNQTQHTTLRPMTLAAADKATGPDILKIRTFSSRMSVEAKTTERAADRSRRIPKDLHRILAEAIYLPLCCRMTILLSNNGAGVAIKTNTLFDPPIMKLFLQTLTVILTTLGPYAMQLPTVTRETLLLLTALQQRTPGLSLDAAVLPAMLTLLLSVLDVNVEAGVAAEERLVSDFGEMVAELVRWVAGLGEGVSVPEVVDGGVGGGGKGGEGMPWSVVAAGIQVKWYEVGRKFQGRMLGLVGGLGGEDAF